VPDTTPSSTWKLQLFTVTAKPIARSAGHAALDASPVIANVHVPVGERVLKVQLLAVRLSKSTAAAP
jgi:hypothetical protein